MSLKDEEKKAYQREYMRKRRGLIEGSNIQGSNTEDTAGLTVEQVSAARKICLEGNLVETVPALYVQGLKGRYMY